jgi:cytochrome P450
MSDAFSLTSATDPYPEYERMRAAGPVQTTSVGLTFLSHERCSAVLRDDRWGRGTGSQRTRGKESHGNRRSFLRQDPPEHTRLRRLVAKEFSPRVVLSMRPYIQQLADSLIDAALEHDEVDLVQAYSFPLPITVICQLLGVPIGDRGQFSRFAPALARGEDPESSLSPEEKRERSRAIVYFRLYFGELMAKRRRDPGDDLISRLAHVQDAGDTLNDPDLLATCVLLLMAGHETTVNFIGNAVKALLRNPDQLSLLRGGQLPDSAPWVDELLRYDSPVQFMSRLALTDVDHAGEHYPAGTNAVLVLGAANRDPEVFDDPPRLDLTRANVRHMGFGMGIHFCLGAQLARMEGEIALRTLLRRAPGLEFADEPPTYKDNRVMRGMARLPVRLR